MPEGSPPVDLLRGLAVFAEAPAEQHPTLAAALGFERAPTSPEYSDVFLFQLYPYASVHLGPEGMMGGESRERIAGFWSALGYTPPAEPDHLVALLGLCATLGEAHSRLEGAERRLTEQGRRALLDEHLAPWVFAFLDRVRELAPVYADWAALLAEVLRRQVADASGGLPLHLRLAPELPDPRTEGGDAFLAGLLAPVRSGMILTRADLARVSREADLGLRAGERRYALEHLLAQSPEPVLTALAAEAERQGLAHDARTTWLGASAAFFGSRCSATAGLLRRLAQEREPAVEVTSGAASGGAS